MPINTKVSENRGSKNYTLWYRKLYPYVPKTIPFQISELRTKNYTLWYRKLYPYVPKTIPFGKIL